MNTRVSFINNNCYCPKMSFKGQSDAKQNVDNTFSCPNYKMMSYKEKMEHTFTALAAFAAASLLYCGISVYNSNDENQKMIDFMDSVSEKYHTPKTDKIVSPVVADLTGDGHADFIIYDDKGNPTICDVINAEVFDIPESDEDD